MRLPVISALLLACAALVGCQTFTAGETVSDPDPAAVRAAQGRKAAVKPGKAPPPRPNPFAQAPGQPQETATASHILVQYKGSARAKPDITRSKEDARKRAEEARDKAKGAGADFAALAKEYSDGPSGPRGGKLGTFPRGRMVPAFDKAVFGMGAGEVSELVETAFGFHVIYRDK